MRRFLFALVLVTPLLLSVGCANGPTKGMAAYLGMPVTPVIPPPGYIFEQVRAPLSCNYDQTPVNPGKVGKATVRHIGIPFYPFLSFSWDEASLETAAKNGELSEVSYADYETMSVLFGTYTEFTVIAYGK